MATRFATVDEYIDSLPDDVRPLMEGVRRSIHTVVPDIGETISYQMPTFTLDGKPLVHVAAWKKHIGLYPLPPMDDDLERHPALVQKLGHQRHLASSSIGQRPGIPAGHPQHRVSRAGPQEPSGPSRQDRCAGSPATPDRAGARCRPGQRSAARQTAAEGEPGRGRRRRAGRPAHLDRGLRVGTKMKTSADALLGLKMGFDNGGPVSAYIEGRNLFNKAYISSTSIINQATATSPLFEPGNGRAVYAGIKYRW